MLLFVCFLQRTKKREEENEMEIIQIGKESNTAVIYTRHAQTD
jgi:hypothetical protein